MAAQDRVSITSRCHIIFAIVIFKPEWGQTPAAFSVEDFQNMFGFHEHHVKPVYFVGFKTEKLFTAVVSRPIVFEHLIKSVDDLSVFCDCYRKENQRELDFMRISHELDEKLGRSERLGTPHGLGKNYALLALKQV